VVSDSVVLVVVVVVDVESERCPDPKMNPPPLRVAELSVADVGVVT
jgi:hypothetical protein